MANLADFHLLVERKSLLVFCPRKKQKTRKKILRNKQLLLAASAKCSKFFKFTRGMNICEQFSFSYFTAALPQPFSSSFPMFFSGFACVGEIRSQVFCVYFCTPFPLFRFSTAAAATAAVSIYAMSATLDQSQVDFGFRGWGWGCPGGHFSGMPPHSAR